MMLLPEALRRFAVGKEDISRVQKETAFSLCHSGGVWGDYDNTWDFIENDGEGEKKGWRQRNFIKFMAYIKDLFKTESIVLDAIDWKAAGDATVVDVSILYMRVGKTEITDSFPARRLSWSRRHRTGKGISQPDHRRPRSPPSSARLRARIPSRSQTARLLPNAQPLPPPARTGRYLRPEVDPARLAGRRVRRHPQGAGPRAQARRQGGLHRLRGQERSERGRCAAAFDAGVWHRDGYADDGAVQCEGEAG